MSTPLPNPPFVFPARDASETDNQESERTINGRPPLPAFSFNPGSMDSNQAPAPTPSMNRMNGHRRQYSEFVGGEQLVTPGNTFTGQSNEESPVGPMKLPPPGPGFSAGNRRRHAHRRSAAISSVDLTAISNALDLKPFVESAPCEDITRERRPSHEPSQLLPHSATVLSRPTPPASPKIQLDPVCPDTQATTDQQCSNPSPSTPTSPIIPDPVYARKSDTAISSFKAEFPGSAPKSRPRPRTADASLMFEFSENSMTDNSPPTKRPSSAAGHSRSHKSMSSGLLTAAFRKSHVEGDGLFPPSSRLSSSDDDSDINADVTHEALGSPSSTRKTKAKKRQKKVRSWAGSLLIRKTKGHDSKKADTESKSSQARPPALTRTNSDFGSGLDVEFDDDNIVVIRTPTNPTHPETQQIPSDGESWASLEEAWKPRSFYEQTTVPDAMSPVIDLDAALGPFNTPEMRSGNAPESGFSAATKRMYSGGRRGEFVGPEMRYHRRAESAPEMPPFDRAFLGSHRFPTSSSLDNPDVFYEEDEDAFLAATSDTGKDSEEHPQGEATMTESKKSEDSTDSSDTMTGKAVDEFASAGNAGLGIQKPQAGAAMSAPATSSFQDLFKPDQRFYSSQAQKSSTPFSSRPKTALEHAKYDEWQNRTPVPASPEVSPRFLPADSRPMTSPTELSAMSPLSLPGGYSLPNSAFPSPDFNNSSDAPRSITTSSTTDPFPHASMEDVPSLTSSASTMTNTLNRVSATFFTRPRLSTDRSASFSAAVNRRSSQPSSKRSSLASLSKLVVGPHAERSKLSHEEKPPGDEPEKARKKGRRISRLMHFWRAKDKEKLNEPTVQD
ncbi:putative cell wall proline rich protein [Aspergillus mulundensis]|uniref:Cell wall proline rich protein n=1 Tax=Aspergillus mulundensis TaxID=1810919 RepID=A0A3D8SU94_9EURO|nr:hypothetical protein DSM5745_01658 [Aspergillus mulundensis]RDW89883.1 hypothetical protein DSM5745_01658 [Aspergillus mulundensis]